MKSRERLIRALAGLPVDRTPIAPFVHDSTVRAWKKDPQADPQQGVIEFCEHFGFDVIHRSIPVRFDDAGAQSPQWVIEKTQRDEGGVLIRRHTIHCPNGTLSESVAEKRLTPYLTVTARKETLIKTEKDLDALMRFQPQPVAASPEPLRQVKALLGDRGVTAPWIHGVFNYMCELRDLQTLLADIYEDPDFYHKLAHYALERSKQGLAGILREGIDLVSYAGNIASATMVGPRLFREFVLPYEKSLIAFINAQGTGVLYHNCGDGEALIDCYAQLGVRCIESLSEPPYGDNHLDVWAEKCPQDICLMGNIDQISFLKKADPRQVTQRAGEVLRIMRRHPRFILGTSDFLEDDTPEDNLFALARAAARS